MFSLSACKIVYMWSEYQIPIDGFRKCQRNIILHIFYVLDVKIPDDGTDDPFDFKFVRWMTKEKVISILCKPGEVFL